MSELLIGGHTAMTQTGTDPVQFAPTIAFPAEAAIPSIVLTPTATAPTAIEGAIYYDSTSDALKIHDGTSWNNIILSGGGSSLVTETFKTISVTGQDDIIAELTEDTPGSTFNLPDLRAAFLRGAGASTKFTQDHTTTFATAESDTVQGHYHTANYMYNGQLGTASNLHPSTAGGGAVETATHDNVLGPRSDGTNGTPRIANETRPNNIGVNFCIKY
jgi:hypothetical protein